MSGDDPDEVTSTIAATSTASFQPEVWTTSANEALKLYVTGPDGALSFPPAFTYPIFGDAETIYGYQDLQIFLCFDCYTFFPFYNVKYSQKLPDPKIVDIKETLAQVLPELVIFKDEAKWADAVAEEKHSYAIPGTLVTLFTQTLAEEEESDGESSESTFSIYRLNLQSPTGLELHERLQILVLLFIEAGSFIDSADPLWNVYVLYENTGEGEPKIVGFTTVYNYWMYPGREQFDSAQQSRRMKISQFIVLPCYQGHGLGGKFYSSLFEQWHKQVGVREIVVEDPSESFDDMRDREDLMRMTESIDLGAVQVSNISPEWISKTRLLLKIEKRQFARLLEMVLLYKLKAKMAEPDTKRSIRLYIKCRLYQKNKEGLAGMDDETRRDKLQTAYQSLEDDYYRIMRNFKLTIKRKGIASENEQDAKRTKRERGA